MSKNYINKKFEFRLERVRKFIEEIPPVPVLWGTAITLAIFLILLLVVCFVPYPHSQGESIMQHLIWF